MPQLFQRTRADGSSTGVWYCHVRDAEGHRRQVSTRCTDKRAAEIRRRQLEREALAPQPRRAGGTLTQAVQLLISTTAEAARAGRRSKDTTTFYERKGGHLVRVIEGDPAEGTYRPFPLADLEASTVDAYITTRRGEGVSDHTISKELVALRRALKLARRAKLWSGDPAEVLPVAFAPAYRPRERWLPRAELAALLGQLQPQHAARVAFIVATSANWSEAEHVRPEDVAAGSAVLLRGTKRPTRWRTVPIVLPWQESLLKYALEHAQHEGDARRLFAPWSNVRHDLERGAARAKIARLSPNDLRRTCAQWLRASGVPLEVVSAVLGHATTRMVETVYGRQSAAQLAERMRAAACITGASAPIGEVGSMGTMRTAQTEEISGETRGFVSAQGRNRTADTGIFNPPGKVADLWPNPRVSEGNAGSFKRRASAVHHDRASGRRGGSR